MELCSTCSSVFWHVQFFRLRQARQCGCCANRVARIGVAMPDGRSTCAVVFKHLSHAACDHDRTKREVAVGDCFGRRHQIRLHTPVTRA